MEKNDNFPSFPILIQNLFVYLHRVSLETQDIMLISHLNYHLDRESEHSKSTMKYAHSADFSVVDLGLW